MKKALSEASAIITLNLPKASEEFGVILLNCVRFLGLSLAILIRLMPGMEPSTVALPASATTMLTMTTTTARVQISLKLWVMNQYGHKEKI